MLNVLAKRGLFAIDKRGPLILPSPSPVMMLCRFTAKSFWTWGGGHPGVSWKEACRRHRRALLQVGPDEIGVGGETRIAGIAEVLPKKKNLAL